MEANRKRTKVHMLPTEDYTGIVLHGSGLDHFHNNPLSIAYAIDNIGGTPQHLYFTTDEKPKEGDWFINVHPNDNTIDQKAPKASGRYAMNSNHVFINPRKIIATTDPKLTIVTGRLKKRVLTKSLPQPSQATIKAYCEQGGFDECDVEYEVYGYISGNTHIGMVGTDIDVEIPNTGQDRRTFTLKVDPIHNTITTHRIVEKMYSISELEVLITKAVLDYTSAGYSRPVYEWIEENL